MLIQEWPPGSLAFSSPLAITPPEHKSLRQREDQSSHEQADLTPNARLSSQPGSKTQSPNGNIISKLITAVYKANRQDKTPNASGTTKGKWKWKPP